MPKNTIWHQFALKQVTVENRLKKRIAEIHNDVVDLLTECWGLYEYAEESMELVAGGQIGNRHDRRLVESFDDELDTARKLRVRTVWCLRTNSESKSQDEA